MCSKKLLIIGSLPHDNKSETYGGTTVLMQNFLDYLKLNELDNFTFIKANKFYFPGSQLFNIIYLAVNVIFRIPFYDCIVMNAASNGAFLISPSIYIFSKIFRKKFIFRMFGGNLIDLMNTKPFFLVSLFRSTTLNSDLIFVETKEILNFIKPYNPNVYWFPNVRKNDNQSFEEKIFKKRFVFISHVKRSKGVEIIIKAFKLLGNDYRVDIFGPIKDNVLDVNELSTNTVYQGVLKPNEVLDTINNYDVLLLPTFHKGEGYPGIIVEAYCKGIPVITSEWNSIPEIVEDGFSGYLVKPRSVEDLIQKIRMINVENYPILRQRSSQMFENFDSDIVNERIISQIKNI
jgi:glycosyltransferase involved in cell wall biosynthesis